MVKTVLITASLVIWLAVGVSLALLIFSGDSSSETPYTGPYQIKTLVPTPGATFETTTTR